MKNKNTKKLKSGIIVDVFEVANESMRIQMLLSHIDDIEWSATVYDHDYWCDVYAESMTLDDGTMLPEADVIAVSENHECWLMEKYRDFLY